MARVLVTGASGFVGRAAVAALQARGHEVHAVARRPSPSVPADRWHAADLLDAVAVEALLRQDRPSHLLHLAWTTTHGEFWADPANLAWSRATLQLVEAFAAAGGQRAVLSGSCAQYDWSAEALGSAGVASELASARRPATLYGVAKQSTSDLLDAWAARTGLSFATGLVFFPYGPFDQPGRLIPTVAASLLAGRAAEIGAGTEVRDFIHVEDCGAALAAILDGATTGAVNVGSGIGASVAEVATAVARLTDREELLQVGARPGTPDRTRVIADVRRLHEEVGFTPAYDLERGLAATVDWWRGQLSRRR